MVIDAPRFQQDVAQPFALGGWAADLDAAAGTGIDVLHVWAYPLTGGAPVFLGTATSGGSRPDVAAIHGDEFRDSGFGLLVQGLTPGTTTWRCSRGATSAAGSCRRRSYESRRGSTARPRRPPAYGAARLPRAGRVS